MFHHLLEPFAREFSGKRTWRMVSELWQFRNTVTSPGLTQASHYCARRFREAGADTVRMVSYAADGKTRYGNTTLPREWEPRTATLSIVRPAEHARRLTSFAEQPLALASRSAATRRGGVEAPVVVVRDGTRPEHYRGLRVRGKIVLTERAPARVAALAKRHGAVGIVSDTIDRPMMPGCPPPTREPMDEPDAVQWCCLRDDRATRGMWAFMLSPRIGQRLRQLIQESKSPVILHAEVDARLYAGESIVVDAALRGGSREELWVLAHISEPGARDNASGVATSIELARTIKALVDSGTLPPLKRTIRFLLSTEISGFIPYLEQYRTRLPRVLAGLCIDSVGLDMGRVGGEFIIFRSPDHAASFVEHLAAEIAEVVVHMSADNFGEDNYALFPWRHEDFWGNDAFVTDPYYDIPTPQMSCWPFRQYHTSLDRPEHISPENLARTGVICGTFLHFLACAGSDEAAWLSLLTGSKEKVRIAAAIRSEAERQAKELSEPRGRGALVRAARRLQQCTDYHEAIGRDAALSPARFLSGIAATHAIGASTDSVSLAAVSELAVARKWLSECVGAEVRRPAPERDLPEATDACSLIPERLCWRPPADADLPESVRSALRELRSSKAARNGNLSELWPWADGRRSVYEIWKRIRYKHPFPLAVVLEYFRLMARTRCLQLHKRPPEEAQ